MGAGSFVPFRLYPAQRLLKRREDSVKLGARAFDILLALVERAGEVVAGAHRRGLAERNRGRNRSPRAHHFSA